MTPDVGVCLTPLAAIDLSDLARWRDGLVSVFESGGFRATAEVVIEVGLLAWFFYAVLRFLHGTRGLAVLKGVLMTTVVLLLLLWLVGGLTDISFPRLQVAAIALLPFMSVVLVILFQPELRRGFSRLSETARGGKTPPSKLADLAAGFFNMSRQRIGALVVFQQQTGVSGTSDTGVPLDAALSGAMLESIFYPKSPLHDGAVVVQDGRIVAASVMLPLSDSTSISRDLGTRHRAALGLSEETDAVCVVVSEETGRVTVVHRAELYPVEDEEDFVETMQDLLEAYRPSENGGRGFHPWRMVRKDIGRKVAAIAFSVLLWSWLQVQLVGEDDLRLDVTLVASSAEADALRRITPALYIVVPEGYIVRRQRLLDPELNRLRNGRVRLEVKGLRKVIDNLELSAVLTVDDAVLEGAAEGVVAMALTQSLFRDEKGDQPELIEFDVSPNQLRIPLERQTSEVFQLTAANVVTNGRPRQGYRFEESRIAVEPNLVVVTGAKSRVEELLAQPHTLRLAPIDLEGQTSIVSQDVGLAEELADDVALQTEGGVVTVVVPIEAEPYAVDLLSVPVTYENPGVLGQNGWRIVSRTETVDLRITGPRQDLYTRSEEWLRQRIRVVYDWNRATLMQAQEKARVFMDLDSGLARAVRVTTLDGRDPEIEYDLEVVETASGLVDEDAP